MFHQTVANEFAKAVTDDRIGRAGRRVPAGEVARVESKRAAERSIRSFDASLSAIGAVMLLTLVVTGVVGAVVVAAAAIVAVRWRPGSRLEGAPPAGEPLDRWWRWRTTEPDTGSLRRGAA